MTRFFCLMILSTSAVAGAAPPTFPSGCLRYAAQTATGFSPLGYVGGTAFDVKRHCPTLTTSLLRDVFTYAVYNCVPVYFQGGTYNVSPPLVNSVYDLDNSLGGGGGCFASQPQLVMLGDAANRAILKVGAPTGNLGPLVTIVGNKRPDPSPVPTPAPAPRYNQLNWITVENLIFDGDGRPGGGFHLESLSFARFENVKFMNFASFAVQGKKLWDSTFTNVTFENCGVDLSGGAGIPAVNLTILDPTIPFSNSNNVAFTDCTWTQSPYISLALRGGARRNRILRSHFIGDPASTHPFITIVSGALGSDANTITASTFDGSTAPMILLSGSEGNVIRNNAFQNHIGPLITVQGKGKNVIYENRMTSNQPGDSTQFLVLTNSLENVIFGNRFPVTVTTGNVFTNNN